jgi:dienelactone hydrolase
MPELLLFHHAQGLTPGVVAFADELRAAGHTVHTPDLYEGRTFADINDGVAHVQQLGFGTVVERGRVAALELPGEVVYAGMSLGVMPAQLLAQTKPGARGAIFLHGCVPLGEFGDTWPDGVPLQLHTTVDDAWGDVDVARGVAKTVPHAELFLYPGDRHLFTDNSLPAYDAAAATMVKQRVLSFLDEL